MNPLHGRYMLTVVDSLDTLVVLKEYDEFENAVRLVIRGISFDTDITVNLFEANIRILGLVTFISRRVYLLNWITLPTLE